MEELERASPAGSPRPGRAIMVGTEVFLAAMPGMAHSRECGHGITWLTYGLLQEHRFEEAAKQIEACRDSAAGERFEGRVPPLDYDDSKVTSFAEIRLLQSIDTGKWDSGDPFVTPPGPYAPAAFTLAYGEALAAARGGDLNALRASAARLHEKEKDLLAMIESAKQDDPRERYKQRAGIAVLQIDALERLRAGKTDEGLASLRKAAAEESAMALAFGPPEVEKPSFELLGDELLALGRIAEARAAFESALARAPGRTRSLEGLLRTEQALGDAEGADRTREQLRRYVRQPSAR